MPAFRDGRGDQRKAGSLCPNGNVEVLQDVATNQVVTIGMLAPAKEERPFRLRISDQ